MQAIRLKYIILIFILVCGCSGQPGLENNTRVNTIRTDIRYAERFDIRKKDGYSILTVKNPWQGAENVSQSYWLIRKGTVVPAGVDSANVIRVPVSSIICMSTTHLSMISALQEEKTIKGISGSDYLYDEKYHEMIVNHKIADVGYENSINKELVLQISPDIVMVYGIGSESAGYLSKLKELGIKIVFNADYLETDPLGKAEWIKAFGALYNKEEKADSIFSSISKEYEKLKTYIHENIKARPSVFFGFPWKDTWYVSPGNTCITRLISDAGGDYLWKDTKSEVSMPMGIENVFIKALNADYWLNPGSINSRKEISVIDYRLGALPSLIKGNIYNNNRRVSQRGGNDYWESGSLNPQIILKDITAILHPDLFPGYEFYYYRKIE
ncbi:MAG: ABC transporter substrate-binding protein [Odoribacter sp.]|nr:ABC transporter substrate-binding protein [Odoribacter sp.]